VVEESKVLGIKELKQGTSCRARRKEARMGRASRMMASRYAADLLKDQEKQKAAILNKKVSNSTSPARRQRTCILSVIEERDGEDWETESIDSELMGSDISRTGSVDSASSGASGGSSSSGNFFMGLISGAMARRGAKAAANKKIIM
jgi:hypothetical protein